MKINRIDADREVNQEVKRIEIQINHHRYTLTESFGELHIHSHSDKMLVHPKCGNEVSVEGQYNDEY